MLKQILPCDLRLKVNIWRELSEVGSKWNVPWINFGDYNAIRCPSKRSSGALRRVKARCTSGATYWSKYMARPCKGGTTLQSHNENGSG